MKAVLLCSGLARRMNGQVKPLIKVCGREILYRSMKLLKNHGVEEFFVVVNRKNRKAIEEFLKKSGFNFNLVLNEAPERGNGYSLYLTKKSISGDFILVMGDHVFGEKFVEKAVKGKGIVCDRTPKYIDVNEATKVKVKAGRVAEIGKSLDDFDCFDTGFFILDESIFDAAEELVREREVVELSDIVKKANLDVHFVDGELWMDVDTPEDVRRAEDALFREAGKGKGDGFVSRHLNRKISTRISRILAGRVEPNQATFLSFLTGVASSLLLFFNIPVAGILYQISSILDGIDGEIARVTMKISRVGGVVDSILDRVVDFLFLSILAVLTLSEKVEFFIAFLAVFGSIMVSYISERYKGEYFEGFYSRFSVLVPGKRDERIAIVMLFCIFHPFISMFYLFLFLAILTNLRSAEMVFRLLEYDFYVSSNNLS